MSDTPIIETSSGKDAVTVTQMILRDMPLGGFSVTCRVSSGDDVLETRVEVALRPREAS